jgi:hypothetical protein
MLIDTHWKGSLHPSFCGKETPTAQTSTVRPELEDEQPAMGLVRKLLRSRSREEADYIKSDGAYWAHGSALSIFFQYPIIKTTNTELHLQ